MSENLTDIEIEEMPQVCILSYSNEDGAIQAIAVSSPEDAIAIIESLTRMIKIQFPERLKDVFRSIVNG